MIEFRVIKRNNKFLNGFELGIFSDSISHDFTSVRKGKISPKFIFPRSRKCSFLDNLKVNDRVGIVWRPSVGPHKTDLGSVFIIINGMNEQEITPCGSPYLYLNMENCNVSQLQLIPEKDRSRLWCPNGLTERMSFFPVRHTYQAISPVRWDSRLKTSNVKMEKSIDKKAVLTVKPSSDTGNVQSVKYAQDTILQNFTT